MRISVVWCLVTVLLVACLVPWKSADVAFSQPGECFPDIVAFGTMQPGVEMGCWVFVTDWGGVVEPYLGPGWMYQDGLQGTLHAETWAVGTFCMQGQPVKVCYFDPVMDPPCNGDFDGNGAVDDEDVVFFSTEYGNCGSGYPPYYADLSGDGCVDGSDLALLCEDFGRTDCSWLPYIEGYGNSGCLPSPLGALSNNSYPGCGDDGFEIVVYNQSIHITHRSATYNCCPDEIAVLLMVEGNVLRVREQEILSMGCLCLCCYDIESTIVNVPSGVYTLEYWWEDWEGGVVPYVETVVVP